MTNYTLRKIHFKWQMANVTGRAHCQRQVAFFMYVFEVVTVSVIRVFTKLSGSNNHFYWKRAVGFSSSPPPDRSLIPQTQKIPRVSVALPVPEAELHTWSGHEYF